jgi:hypothetical protein
MKKFLIVLTLLAIVVLPALADGPVSARVYTGTTSGVKVNFQSITSGTPTPTVKRVVYVGCADDNFQVLAWRYTGSGFSLVSPAVADTSSAGALANSFMLVEGYYDFLVIKTATASAAVSVQRYNP